MPRKIFLIAEDFTFSFPENIGICNISEAENNLSPDDIALMFFGSFCDNDTYSFIHKTDAKVFWITDSIDEMLDLHNKFDSRFFFHRQCLLHINNLIHESMFPEYINPESVFSLFFCVDSTYESIDTAVRRIEEFIKRIAKFDDSVIIFQLNVVSRELLTNAVKYGNLFDTQKQVFISISFEDKEKRICLKVKDEGKGFDFPGKIESVEDLREGQRGFFIVSSYTERFLVNKNLVTAELKF
ncbi:MAG: ATP-binding protein [Candidatus Cloacimonetes bacterium]|nr:ATP-binding protein [Candidatus Cloacimonadota bacterium]